MQRLATRWWSRKWRGEVPTEQLPDVPVPAGVSVDEHLELVAALARRPEGQRRPGVLR